MRFSANVCMLFCELPFLARFEAAAACGFGAVELWWPAGLDHGALGEAVRRAGVEVALMNLDAGDVAGGDRGYVNDASRSAEFRRHVPAALDLAERLGCRQVNALAGRALPGVDAGAQLATARENIGFAADAAAQRGIRVVIEPVNPVENPGYLLPHSGECADFIASLGRENVRLQYDVYHAQRTEGELSETIARLLPTIGHVQIADAPGRGEPGTGEIRFAHVLGLLERLGYAGHVGLEYRPTTPATADSFGWIEELGLTRR
ncbi:hydroxypyruvate isomerase family protein [Capillimicrobium parvum]|uniref:Hydroxypyruvate isomerase n=1 Tax=Capillimicrobium parvum TaxID=2884022 RepID=A0A9E6Y0C9_9ACTN|nr:TIM barrel protein [Capillimicrobium parvum]UGS37805.1 Hydroxypyruvate isomerase [Capillimicrobium parvum]